MLGALACGATALLAAVILMGVTRPQSLWVQGVAFAVLGLGWLVVRLGRSHAPVRGGSGRVRRTATSVLLVVGAGVLALPVAGWVDEGDDTDGVGATRALARYATARRRCASSSRATPPSAVSRAPPPSAVVTHDCAELYWIRSERTLSGRSPPCCAVP